MEDRVTLDKAGRLVVPKALRDEMGLAPGDQLDVRVEGEQMILTPRRTVPPLQKERGVWVFRTGEPLTSELAGEVLRRIREPHTGRGSR
jgi:AbrB family looped-hinge helix DNA binding protein